jgi:hypothetical protein
MPYVPIPDPVIWIAHHDNGWTTHVSETADGVFHASAARSGATGFLCQYVELNEPRAKAAALYALALQTGHNFCSDRCSTWHTHSPVNDRAYE